MVENYDNYKFSFEKLDVYKKSIEFTNQVFNLTAKFRNELNFSLGDQFRRAALSICNNLAEGSDKQTKNSKTQFYAYALDSARECIPMITLAKMQSQINGTVAEHLRNECIHICNMLAKLLYSTKNIKHRTLNIKHLS